MWDIHIIIHGFSTTMDGLYMADTQTLQWLIPELLHCIIVWQYRHFSNYSGSFSMNNPWVLSHPIVELFRVYSKFQPHLLMLNSQVILCKIQCFPSYLYNIHVFIQPYSWHFPIVIPSACHNLFHMMSQDNWLATHHLFRTFSTTKKQPRNSPTFVIQPLWPQPHPGSPFTASRG